jgi:hypothetical protein
MRKTKDGEAKRYKGEGWRMEMDYNGMRRTEDEGRKIK